MAALDREVNLPYRYTDYNNGVGSAHSFVELSTLKLRLISLHVLTDRCPVAYFDGFTTFDTEFLLRMGLTRTLYM